MGCRWSSTLVPFTPQHLSKLKETNHNLVSLSVFYFLLAPPTTSLSTHRPASNNQAPEMVAATALVGSQDSSHRDEYGGEAAAAWTHSPPRQSEGEKASCRSASPWELLPPGSDWHLVVPSGADLPDGVNAVSEVGFWSWIFWGF